MYVYSTTLENSASYSSDTPTYVYSSSTTDEYNSYTYTCTCTPTFVFYHIQEESNLKNNKNEGLFKKTSKNTTVEKKLFDYNDIDNFFEERIKNDE